MTGPLKEEILNGRVHTIDEIKAWLKPLGYSDTINEAAINSILSEYMVSSEISLTSCISLQTSNDCIIIVTLLVHEMHFVKSKFVSNKDEYTLNWWSRLHRQPHHYRT